MLFKHTIFVAAAFASTLVLSQSAQATTEICGDGIDNTSPPNGLADEGCYPQGVTGICESPLSCGQTGAVAPVTGQLVYHEPSDLAPSVPYGPSIAFRRFYMSKFDPGYADPADTNFMAPMGYGWHHNFMSWIKLDGQGTNEVTVHAVTGQDILFTRTSTAGGYDTYAPQVGFHFDYLRRAQSSPYQWELRTLSGQVYKYSGDSPQAKLIGILDSVGNEVALEYHTTGCVDQLKKVTDASGNKYLELAYGAHCMLDTVKYFAAGTERVEVDYTYDGTETYELTQVDIGSDLARQYTYDASHKLTEIDIRGGDLDNVADFTYIDGQAGKIARIDTGNGVIGYAYGMGKDDCLSPNPATLGGDLGTCVFYHRASTTACGVDDGSNFCGGETSPTSGTTGSLFRATRWLGVTSDNEDLIDSVAGSCANCTDVIAYDWDTGPSGDGTKLLLDGVKDPENVWTNYERNANGLVIKMVENDTNPSTEPSGSRVTYYSYGNATYPGLVTEVRRLSELKPSGTCTASITTDCKRSIYTYTAEGLVDTIQEKGFTYNTSASTVAYDFTTDWDYDGSGRVTKYKGPRTDTSDDVTDYTYHSSIDTLIDGYRNEVKRQKASSTFITTTTTNYDYWGNAVNIENPNGDFTCLTFDGDRNVLATRRIAMNGQTSCVTVDSLDLTTQFTYDTALRLTKLSKPLGNCMHRSYDTWGRTTKLMSRDDCNITTSSGDDIEFGYNNDGLRVAVIYKDASGATTYWKEMTYSSARRLETTVFADVVGSERTLSYEADGQLSSVADEGDGKTEWQHDEFGRLDLIKRFTGASTSDDWAVTPGAQTDLPTQVSDPDNKVIDWVWDDMGRKVKQETFESGITTYVYDPAGNLTTRIEDDGGLEEMINVFTYDSLNRLTEADYGDADCFTLGDAEIEYTYDTLSGCPTGTCVRGLGRLVKVETQLFCDSLEADDAFDQQTYYGYDRAGRMIAETIEDDGSRSAAQTYAWDKNGNNLEAVAPSGAIMSWVYGASPNSDQDKVDLLKRNTEIITNWGRWLPFGPLESYRHKNKLPGSTAFIEARFVRDLGYRPESLQYKNTAGTNVLKIDYGWDSSGNLIKRDYTGAHTSVGDDHFTYDWLDRVTCNSTSASCGGGTKSVPSYNVSGDRTSIVQGAFPHANGTFATAYVMDGLQETHQIDDVTVSPEVTSFSFDGRGNRLYDDNTTHPDDRRDYDYDARNNLVAVTGHYKVATDTLHPYTMINAYDHKNRRIFKSFVDRDTGTEAQWFFYYDAEDRLFEIKYTPDESDSSTYSLHQFYWIGSRLISSWQVNYPTVTTTKRYVHSDEMNRPLEMYSWSDTAAREWAINPYLFGWDRLLLSTVAYQPIGFPGQYSDDETMTYYSFRSALRELRPPLRDNRFRTYDPWTGTYLQVDPKVDSTWEAYNYAGQNPVMNTDPTGESWWDDTKDFGKDLLGHGEDVILCVITGVFTLPSFGTFLPAALETCGRVLDDWARAYCALHPDHCVGIITGTSVCPDGWTLVNDHRTGISTCEEYDTPTPPQPAGSPPPGDQPRSNEVVPAVRGQRPLPSVML